MNWGQLLKNDRVYGMNFDLLYKYLEINLRKEQIFKENISNMT